LSHFGVCDRVIVKRCCASRTEFIGNLLLFENYFKPLKQNMTTMRYTTLAQKRLKKPVLFTQMNFSYMRSNGSIQNLWSFINAVFCWAQKICYFSVQKRFCCYIVVEAIHNKGNVPWTDLGITLHVR